MQEENKKEGLNIELTEEVAQGTYSNLAIINHSPSEFVVDFIQMMPGIQKAKVKSRVILTPQHAKRLMSALSDNISKFESQNGKIQDDFEIVDEHDLLSKLIETSKSKDKPIVVQNNQKQIIGVITQSDLLKAVIEGGDGE